MLEPFDNGRNAGVLRRQLHAGLLVGRTSARSNISSARAASPTRFLANGTPNSPASAICFAPEKVDSALQAVYRENFRPSLRDHFNPCRIYAYEDEGGLLIATYPEGAAQPVVPVALCRGSLDRPRIRVGLAHDHARVGRGGSDDRPRRARAPRRRAPQSLERYRVRLLLRALDVGFAAGQRLVGLSVDQRVGEIGFRSGARQETRSISGPPVAAGARSPLRRAPITNGQGGELGVLAAAPSACRAVDVDGRPAEREVAVVLLEPAHARPGEPLSSDERGAA